MADSGSDFNDRLKGVDRLKRNKPEERAERERLRKELEEDKARRAEIFGAQKAEREEKAAAAAAASAAYRDTSTSQLSIRTESGALRHTFPAETTLAEVRTWVLEEGRRVAVEAQRAAANAAAVDSDGIGAGRTLGATGAEAAADAEAARAGRENFERQTARLREEARNARAGMERLGGVGPGAGNDARVYFVSLIPRREFLSEEELATTTLAAAGLVPNGTLMVRQQLVAPPDAGPGVEPEAEGEAAADDDDTEAMLEAGAEDDDDDGDDDDEGEEEEDDDEDEDSLPRPAQVGHFAPRVA